MINDEPKFQENPCKVLIAVVNSVLEQSPNVPFTIIATIASLHTLRAHLEMKNKVIESINFSPFPMRTRNGVSLGILLSIARDYLCLLVSHLPEGISFLTASAVSLLQESP